MLLAGHKQPTSPETSCRSLKSPLSGWNKYCGLSLNVSIAEFPPKELPQGLRNLYRNINAFPAQGPESKLSSEDIILHPFKGVEPQVQELWTWTALSVSDWSDWCLVLFISAMTLFLCKLCLIFVGGNTDDNSLKEPLSSLKKKKKKYPLGLKGSSWKHNYKPYLWHETACLEQQVQLSISL